MHQGEIDVDVGLVRALVAAQFPELGDLPVSAVQSTGTVNAIYRLGDHLCVRLPRVEDWARDLDNELRWLPTLAPHVSLQVPEPVEQGRRGTGRRYGYTRTCCAPTCSFAMAGSVR